MAADARTPHDLQESRRFWLYQSGAGVARAGLIDGGTLVEMQLERADQVPVGSVRTGRLGRKGGIGTLFQLEGGGEWWLDGWPEGMTEGARVSAALTREGLPDSGRAKRPRARLVDPATPTGDGPDLYARLAASGLPVHVQGAYGPDRFTELGWTENFEAALSGRWPFAGGTLLIALTPGMTVIDVDGWLPVDRLAVAGADAAARAIRLFDLTGGIAIDLPTTANRAVRQACATAFDRALPQPFARTAVNGFGLLQVVRPRLRASVCELLTAHTALIAGADLLWRAERCGRVGAAKLVAAPSVIGALEAQPSAVATLARHLGGRVDLRADPALGMWGGHVVPA